MNDRFKFRVWDNNKKEYLDKGYIHRKGYLVMPTMKNDYSLAEAEGDFVIEQCTGLKDKNGKLIYEGDILGDIFGGYVGWCDKEKSFELFAYDWGCMSCSGDILWAEIIEDEQKLEVIGNIHENPELLEG